MCVCVCVCLRERERERERESVCVCEREREGGRERERVSELRDNVDICKVIYLVFCLDVAQGCTNEPPIDIQTH